jgi:hypothetical protein
VGRFEKILEIRAREALEFCKQTLKGDSGQSSEDQNPNRSVDTKGQTHKISGGNGYSVGT